MVLIWYIQNIFVYLKDFGPKNILKNKQFRSNIRLGKKSIKVCVYVFLGVHAPLEIAPVSQSVRESVSHKKFEAAPYA